MITEYSYTFSKDHAPVSTVAPGSTLTFKTLDCFSNKICSEKDLITAFDFNSANPATGPVYIEGAEPGDTLVVDVQKISIGEQGVVTTLPGVGPLHDRAETRTKVLKVQNGHARFNDLDIKLNPMIGVIGTAPDGDPVPGGFPGNHGGNMDCNLITEGARLYLPVRIAGALLQMGDLHAVMGDGELCGTGMEIAGEITVKVGLLKNKKLDWPVLDAAGKWHVIASDMDYTKALVEASRQMETLMSPAYGWDSTDTYFYLSLQGDVHVCQGCQPCPVAIVLRMSVPKRADKPLLPSPA